MSEKDDPLLAAVIERMKATEDRLTENCFIDIFRENADMQKTDAELIAEAKDWAADLLSEDCVHTSQMIVELARRLKAANEERAELKRRLGSMTSFVSE